MGNYMTKLLMHPSENQKESNVSHVKQQVATDNSMCTPVSEKKMLCDPRSVSAGISRTPIEQVVTQDSSMCTPILSDKRMLQDPRSISAGIARTPIEAIMQDSSMCTPTLPVKKILYDPRSVSAGISRTPIEVEGTPVSIVTKRAPSAIPKYLRKKEYLETDMDVVMPPLSPKKRFVPKLIDSDQGSKSDGTQDYLTPNIMKDSKSITPIEKERYAILGLDPRSPAANFDRTPILIPKSLALIKARSQEVLSRRGSYELDIYNPTNLHKKISTSIPKIQLLPDKASETPETLDMEEQNESFVLYTSQQSDSDTSIFEEEEVTVIKNPKCKNEMEKSSISDEQTVATDEEKDKDNINMKDDCKDIENDMKTIIIKDDTNDIEVWYDSVSSEDITGKKEKENIVEKFLQRKSPREDVIIMFDECATTSTSLKPLKTEEVFCQKSGDIIEREKKSTKIDATVTSNEKKIFNFPEKKIHGAEVLKNRIPFGNRSNNDQVQINSPQHLSRNKTVSTKTQQENTPPCMMYNIKSKNGRYWDPNTTVFI